MVLDLTGAEHELTTSHMIQLFRPSDFSSLPGAGSRFVAGLFRNLTRSLMWYLDHDKPSHLALIMKEIVLSALHEHARPSKDSLHTNS